MGCDILTDAMQLYDFSDQQEIPQQQQQQEQEQQQVLASDASDNFVPASNPTVLLRDLSHWMREDEMGSWHLTKSAQQSKQYATQLFTCLRHWQRHFPHENAKIQWLQTTLNRINALIAASASVSGEEQH
ncbi:MAG TPA: hypothetical protein V6C97_21630, partial [Oculatellaceae cyanobacterium]